MAGILSELKVGNTLYQFSSSGVIITDATPTSLAGVMVGNGNTVTAVPIDEQPTAGSDNFVTSGAVAAAIAEATGAGDVITTGTINTNSTSVTVNYTGRLKGVFAEYGGSIVLCDTQITSTGVTFSVAEAPPAAITCYVLHGS